MGCSPVHTLGRLKALINMPTWPSAKKYHDCISSPLMVSLLLALLVTENTINDADFIVNLIDLIVINLLVKNSGHSHSIINKPFLSQLQA